MKTLYTQNAGPNQAQFADLARQVAELRQGVEAAAAVLTGLHQEMNTVRAQMNQSQADMNHAAALREHTRGQRDLHINRPTWVPRTPEDFAKLAPVGDDEPPKVNAAPIKTRSLANMTADDFAKLAPEG